MLLLIDNHDSFTHNLVHAFEILEVTVKVVSNNELSADQCLQLDPRWIVISPGPSTPANAGISKKLIRAAAGKIPLLGVCLGHQAVAEEFGGTIRRAERPMHGFLSEIAHDGLGVFKEIPSHFRAVRYHSLIVDSNLPDCLQAAAWTSAGEIMGIRHKEYEIEGVQFHPEALLTEYGMTLLNNFLNRKEHSYVKESPFYINRCDLPVHIVR